MKNSFTALILIFTLFSSCKTQQLSPAEQTNEGRRNILFIAVDDLKPLLGSYGATFMHTPNFDRLSKMGVTFTNAHVQQAVCGPSRASVMTGSYPDITKVWDLHTDFREVAPELKSMPEYLIEQGYESTGVGKIYHKGSSSPGHDGKSWSIPHTIPTNYDPNFGEPMFSYYQDQETKREMQSIIDAKGDKKGLRNHVFKKLKPSTESADVSDEAYQDGLYTQEAIMRMKTLSAGEKPFFLAVGFQKPHLPFVAPKKYWDLYDREKVPLAKFQKLADGTPMVAYHNFGELRSYSDIDSDLDVGDQLPIDKQRELVHGYMACISYIDAQLGKLLDAVEELGLSNNTNIVLWGDHGFHLGDHTEWCKHSNFEQATRIPFVFAGPGVAKDVKSNAPVELIDLFPTIFDLTGVPIPNQADGKSLTPLMDNDPSSGIEMDYAISQFGRGKNRMGYSIRTDRYRYTEWHSNNFRSYLSYDDDNIVGRELYDYVEDPLETRNHVEDDDRKEIVKELKGKLKLHFENIKDKK